MTEPEPAHQPPYWAVIFTNQRRDGGDDEYGQAANRMQELASRIPGFLGIESVRNQDGFGITVSYWESEEAIAEWRSHPEHLDAQSRGRRDWYSCYELRVAKVERAASFEA